jgi:hypothetical protein
MRSRRTSMSGAMTVTPGIVVCAADDAVAQVRPVPDVFQIGTDANGCPNARLQNLMAD